MNGLLVIIGLILMFAFGVWIIVKGFEFIWWIVKKILRL